MTNEDALVIVDSFRQQAVVAAMAADQLLHVVEAAGYTRAEGLRMVGVSAAVLRWCYRQRELLEQGTDDQAAVLNRLGCDQAEDDCDLHQLLLDWCRRT
jgi:hypothetical protein